MSQQNSEPRVLKHPLASRLLHWCLILGFLPAALTGFILWLKPGSENFINQAMHLHIFGASILTIGASLYTIFCYDRIVLFARRIFTWNKNDLKWFMVLGGYPQKMLFGKKIPLPPMGKINSGQKILCISMLIGGPILIVTGWALFAFIPLAPKAAVYWMNAAHLGFGLFLGCFLFIHMFLGVYCWNEFKIMFGDGTQSLAEAKEHTPVWVEKEIEAVDRISPTVTVKS